MTVNISIKNAPDEIAALLKERAKRNHRSMQREILAILDEVLRTPRRLTPDEALAEIRRLGLKTPSESTEIIRKMRDDRYGS